VEEKIKSRFCRWQGGIGCNYPSCGFVNTFGDVLCCRHHLNPDGMNQRRVSKEVFRRRRKS